MDGWRAADIPLAGVFAASRAFWRSCAGLPRLIIYGALVRARLDSESHNRRSAGHDVERTGLYPPRGITHIRNTPRAARIAFDYARVRIAGRIGAARSGRSRRRAVRMAEPRRGAFCYAEWVAFLMAVLVYAMWCRQARPGGLWGGRCAAGQTTSCAPTEAVFYVRNRTSRGRSRMRPTLPTGGVWPDSPSAEAIVNLDHRGELTLECRRMATRTYITLAPHSSTTSRQLRHLSAFWNGRGFPASRARRMRARANAHDVRFSPEMSGSTFT